MGSFTELVLSIRLRDDAPQPVLAAFSSLRIASPEAPELPDPPETDWFWDPTDPDGDDQVPWAHDWGPVLGSAMAGHYIQSPAGASLTWSVGGRWVLTCRCSLKTNAEVLGPPLAWIGEFAEGGSPEHPLLVGTMDYEYDDRPWLIWHRGGPLVFEDLNEPGPEVPAPQPGATWGALAGITNALTESITFIEGDVVERARRSWLFATAIPVAVGDAGSEQLQRLGPLLAGLGADPTPEVTREIGRELDGLLDLEEQLGSAPDAAWAPWTTLAAMLPDLDPPYHDWARGAARALALGTGEITLDSFQGSAHLCLNSHAVADLRAVLWARAMATLSESAGLGRETLSGGADGPSGWHPEVAGALVVRSLLADQEGWADPFGEMLELLRSSPDTGWEVVVPFLSSRTTQPVDELLAATRAELAHLLDSERVSTRLRCLDLLAIVVVATGVAASPEPDGRWRQIGRSAFDLLGELSTRDVAVKVKLWRPLPFDADGSSQ